MVKVRETTPLLQSLRSERFFNMLDLCPTFFIVNQNRVESKGPCQIWMIRQPDASNLFDLSAL